MVIAPPPEAGSALPGRPTGHIDLSGNRDARIRFTNCFGNESLGLPRTSCRCKVELDICLVAGTPDTPDQYIREEDCGFWNT